MATTTHHPVRLFRLSCGCLRAYPMMAAGTVHSVLCAGCRSAAVTVAVYPERTCGARGHALICGRLTAVACTTPKGACDGVHVDACAHPDGYTVEFTTKAAVLAGSREGRTGRA